MSKILRPISIILFLMLSGAGNLVSAQNIAQGKPAYASSLQDDWSGYDPTYANDGNTGTRWSSYWTDDEWWYVDLEAEYDLSSVRILWETALGREYLIQVANTNPELEASWTTVNHVTGNTLLDVTYDMTGNSGRYVRMKGIQRGTGYGYSIFEFQVFGETIAPVNLVDFHAKTTTSGIVLHWSATMDFETVFKVEKSTDGKNFEAIHTLNVPYGSPNLQSYTYTDPSPRPGINYYRVNFSEAGGAPGYSRIIAVSTQGSRAITAYPNPVSGNNPFYIDLGEPVTGKLTVKILNISGIEVARQEFNASSRQQFKIELAGTGFFPGMYTIQTIIPGGGIRAIPVLIK